MLGIRQQADTVSDELVHGLHGHRAERSMNVELTFVERVKHTLLLLLTLLL